MKHTHDLLRERLHLRAGIMPTPTKKSPHELRALLDKWSEEQWSAQFEELMRNRLLMGKLRYNANKPGFLPRAFGVNLKDIQKRLESYMTTGNTEGLVDAANLCMVEFITTKHPSAHFKGTDRP